MYYIRTITNEKTKVMQVKESYKVESGHEVEVIVDGQLYDELYEGESSTDAQITFDSFNPEDYGVEGIDIKIIWRRDVYCVIPNPQDGEELEDFLLDYPVKECWMDSEVYTIVGDEPEKVTNQKEFGVYYANIKSDELLQKVSAHFDVRKYRVFNANGRKIQLRIANHSENASNIEKFEVEADYYLSVVIADADAITGSRKEWFELDRPENSHQIYFTSENSEEEIIEAVNSFIF